MANKWSINESLIGDVRSALDNLDNRITDIEYAFEDMSEKWQESDRGQSVQEWLRKWQDLTREMLDTLDELEDANEWSEL